MEDAQHRATRPFSPRNGPVRQPLGIPSVPGAVEQGVQTAYTVIDAHLQRGRQEAERLRQGAQGFSQSFNGGPSPWTDAGWGSGARSTDPFPGMGAGAASSPALMGALLQMMQAWGAGLAALTPLVAQAAASVANVANTAAPQHPAQPAHPHASPNPQASQAPHAPRAQLSVELLSKRLGEVSVSLEPGADMETLRAVFATPPGTRTGTDTSTDTRTQGPWAEFYAAPGQVRVRLNAAENTVAGRHEATVLDQTGRPWGQVSIMVSPQPATDPWVQP